MIREIDDGIVGFRRDEPGGARRNAPVFNRDRVPCERVLARHCQQRSGMDIGGHSRLQSNWNRTLPTPSCPRKRGGELALQAIAGFEHPADDGETGEEEKERGAEAYAHLHIRLTVEAPA